MATTSNVNVILEAEGVSWDHVKVQSLSGREVISQPFWFDVGVVCDAGHDLPEQAVPGADISLVVEIDGAEARRFHGVLGPIRDSYDSASDHSLHWLRVIPHVSQLALVETQEVFLEKSIPDILRAKLERHGLDGDDFEMRLMGTYPVREIVVQYQESDLAFVSRLAEHAGIAYFFEHQGDRDKMVFTDHPDGFRPAEGAEQVSFDPRGQRLDVFSLELLTDAIPTSYIVQDYNYRAPQVDLSASFDLDTGSGGGIVEYGAHGKTPEDSERLARIRAEERECRRRVYEGKCGHPAFRAGGKTTLADLPKRHGPEPLLLVEVQHEVKIAVLSEAGSATEYAYKNSFRAIPASLPYRPPRLTPRPRIAGVLTGIIQPGPNGETGGVAQIDSDGRYTVQFHFDTAAPGEQKASHPVRLAQPFAGAGYGMHMPLRPGTEVIMAFTNGDPDRPVIVGALYNASSPSPIAGRNANRHQIRSNNGAVVELGSKT